MIADSVDHPIAKAAVRAKRFPIIGDDFGLVGRWIEANVHARIVDRDSVGVRRSSDVKLLALSRREVEVPAELFDRGANR